MVDKAPETPKMQYRHLGETGLKVSVISYGNWLNSNDPKVEERTVQLIKKAWDLGINFFDTAEVYGYGQAEIQMGKALKALGVKREDLVVSTKIFWGTEDVRPNTRGLSRKHIKEGVKQSLERLGLDYVDVVFCHRFDTTTPVEETVRAFDDLIKEGKIHYWGTSEWTAANIFEVREVCEKYNLIKPSVE